STTRTAGGGCLQLDGSMMTDPAEIKRQAGHTLAISFLLLAVLAATPPAVRGADAADEPRHWAFQPVRRPEGPDVRHNDLVRNPVDAFLLARLEEQGLTFSPPAERRELIRRLKFDLLGFPPTPQEVAAFLADDAPGAYERLVEKFLESPHYGEHW